MDQRETKNSEITEVKGFLASLEKKASNKEKTGSKINESLVKTITTLMRQKPDDECEKIVL